MLRKNKFSGTVFTSKRIEPTKPGFEKKFFTVFSKRIAETAQPEDCHSCECTADEHGNSYMECLPCEYPTSPDVTLVSEQVMDNADLFIAAELSSCNKHFFEFLQLKKKSNNKIIYINKIECLVGPAGRKFDLVTYRWQWYHLNL